MRTALRQHGFTLIELMIVVSIIAILTGLAVNGYRKSVLKTNRQYGSACLVEVQKRMENFYGRNNAYPAFSQLGLDQLGYSSPYNCPGPDSNTVLYTLTLTKNTVCSTVCYQLQAAGVGQQGKDGTLVLSVDPRGTAGYSDVYHKQHIPPSSTTLVDGWTFSPGQ